MTKKLVVLLLFFLGSVSSDVQDDIVSIPKKEVNKHDLIKKHTYLYPGRTENKVADNGDWPHSFLFNYDDENPEYYLSGGIAGDQLGVWFQPPATAYICSLLAIEWQFYQETDGDTINVHVYPIGTVSPDTVPNGDSIAVDSIFNEEGDYLPEGIPVNIQATSDWERLDLSELGYQIDVISDIFWVVWEKTGDSPMILGDSDNPGNYLHTWSYEPNQDGDTAWSHYGSSVGIEAMVRCEVLLYVPQPPYISAMQMWDTYSTGPYTLNAYFPSTSDIPVESCTLFYSINQGEIQSTIAIIDDTLDVLTFTAEIPSGSVGDEIRYQFVAYSPSGYIQSSSWWSEFAILEPMNPSAKILILDEGQAGLEPDRDEFDEILFYIEAIEFTGFNSSDYEIWVTPDHHGYDESVISYGWNTILVFAWGSNTFPTRDYATGFGKVMADFLDNGGRLLYADMDYFFSNGEDDDPDFEVGDFAYDYFGLESGINDPSGPGADSIYTGVEGDSISGDFATIPVECQFYRLLNWVDYLTPRSEADVIFNGESGNAGAVKYTNGNFKTTYFAFNLANIGLDTASIVPDEFKTIVGNFLEWAEPEFGIVDEIGNNVPTEYKLSQNYPNPFNSETLIAYSVPQRTTIRLSIYDLTGREVTQLVQSEHEPGIYQTRWNGKDKNGVPVASGVYLYHLQSQDFFQTRKLILLR